MENINSVESVSQRMGSIRRKILGFNSAIVVLGLSGIVAQILLLRELLITFYGNELSIGIILANWLFLESVGAFLVGKQIEKIRNKLELFVILTFLFSLSLPAAVYLTRILKDIVGITYGETLGISAMLYSSFLIFLPVSLCHGTLFTFSCKIYSEYSSSKINVNPAGREAAIDIGKVYIYETLGTIIGGIIFTYICIPHFHSFQIAFGLSLLNFIVCVLILGPFWRKKNIFIRKIAGFVSVILLISFCYIVFSSKANSIHLLSIENQWKEQKVLYYKNSIYGNVVVTKRYEQYTFFSNGIPIIATPTPDIASVEEFAHLPMLSHPNPKEILVISGGAGGLINEILKYDIKRIDYVELDSLILEVVNKFPTPLTEKELTDPRVKIEYVDGRLFAKRAPNKYDLILIGFSAPLNLQLNRFFSKEFFFLVKSRLKENGILVLGLPGSLTYLNDEMKNVNRCIFNALRITYPHIRIIPGDGTNLYLASDSKSVSLIEQEKLSQRLKEYGLKTSLITSLYIEYKLQPRWLNWFLSSLENGTTKVNYDFKPLGVFFNLAYWNAMISPYMRPVFRLLEKINLTLIFILCSIVTLIFLAVSYRIKNPLRLSIPLCIITTGFAGMLFDLLLIFAFQILYGYVFYWIGLLVTTFMIGTVSGSLWMTQRLGKIKKDTSSFLRIERALIIFSGILPIMFLLFEPHVAVAIPAISLFLQIAFLLLSFISGLFIGLQFPLANKIYLSHSSGLSSVAGLLYACDLFGGWIGGMLGGVALLPVLGLVGTCIVVVMFKVCSFIILVASLGKSVLRTA